MVHNIRLNFSNFYYWTFIYWGLGFPLDISHPRRYMSPSVSSLYHRIPQGSTRGFRGEFLYTSGPTWVGTLVGFREERRRQSSSLRIPVLPERHRGGCVGVPVDWGHATPKVLKRLTHWCPSTLTGTPPLPRSAHRPFVVRHHRPSLKEDESLNDDHSCVGLSLYDIQ